MNRLRVCLLLFAFTVVVAARAVETNTPTTAGATTNAAPSAVTSNPLPAGITIDGITYSNVTWRTVTPATVTIFHVTGVTSIPLGKLHGTSAAVRLRQEQGRRILKGRTGKGGEGFSATARTSRT